MFKTIKSRLVAACAAVVVLAIVLSTALSYRTTRALLLNEVQQKLTDLSLAHVGRLGNWVRTQMNIVAGMGLSIDPQATAGMLAQAQKAGSLDLAYFGGADKRMESIPVRQRAPDYDPTARPWYKQASSGEGVIITPPYLSSSGKKLVVTFAQAVKKDGTQIGVVASDVAMDDVVQSLAEIKPTPSGFALLINQKGMVISHTRPEYTLKPVTEVAPGLEQALAAAGNSGDLRELTLAGQGYFLRAATVAGTDWKLVIAAHRDEALAPLKAVLRDALLALVLVVTVSVLGAAAVVRSLLGRLDAVRQAMETIGSSNTSGGDLTQRLHVDGQDEIARIAHAFNRFVEHIEIAMVTVRDTAASIMLASREVASGSHDLSHRTELTASHLQAANDAMQDLIRRVDASTGSANQAHQQAQGSATVAHRGGEVVSQVVSTMQEISASSDRISDIIGTIDGIAFQTNILALNAAVEAARAGEQGRGFAVVASEVRSLAGRSAEAAKEIKALIASSVSRVEEGSRLVGDAGSTMQEIVASVRSVSSIIGSISEGASDQNHGIQDITRTVSQIENMTQQNAALVEQSTAAAQSLQEQAQRLDALVSAFKVRSLSPA